LGPGVGAAALGSPGEPQYAVGEGGSGHAGIGALEPVAVVGGPGHVVAAVPGGDVDVLEARGRALLAHLKTRIWLLVLWEAK